MLNQSFLKISVLVATLCLNALRVSSMVWNCPGQYTIQGVCDQNKDDGTTNINCHPESCSNGGKKWVPMSNCVWNDRYDVPGLSKQQCAQYTYVTSDKTYDCKNPAGHNYICSSNPTGGFMTCTDCFTVP
ncbi:uncharacterized protein MELLADRAFT_124163 [Melampsora larici-populina 98AG31]|uniref:Secreted protein n=1 Tax=Melampsora larici-populina (strain 98AG31 / pathotype 3-4-7) TaxID=747676 RepID=F4RM56_MELLP|nr:uncharacterized protein MELLADRAFT_124163 [Melampsora larici-populina 98AG31]EGG06529.1 secreted protein [Melampsora larici-populina 98AG31]